MSEYIKREDIIKALGELCNTPAGQSTGLTALVYAAKTIEGLPTADVVEVVRCKDCSRWCICHKSDDYFCADGKRRSEWTTIPIGTGSALTVKCGKSHAVSAGREADV